MRIANYSAIVLASALMAAPALAQSTSASGTTTAPTARTTIGTGMSNSSNPVLTHGADVRASKVIGSSVYNDPDVKVGTVDDIVIGSNDKAAQVVLSVGGFLGMGSKLVAVPYTQLQFGNTQQNGDNRVKLPGATKQSLTSMSDYNYSRNG